MRIRSEQLKKLAAQAGATADSLGEAIERPGLEGERATRAARNWMRGSDNPKAKAQDINRLAQALGCSVGDLVRFVSKVRYHRGSPQKARLVADLIRNRPFVEADTILAYANKRAAVNVRAALNAAKDEAQEQGIDIETLIVSESTVDVGPTIKRFQPKDRGRAHPIMKRTSHITVGVEGRS